MPNTFRRIPASAGPLYGEINALQAAVEGLDTTVAALPPPATTVTLAGVYTPAAGSGADALAGLGDDSAAIDAAAAEAVAAGGGVVQLTKAYYGIGATILNNRPGVTLRGAPGGTTLVKRPVVSATFLSGDGGSYRNNRFENLIWDGRSRLDSGVGALGGLTFSFYDAIGIGFIDCQFRDSNYAVVGQAARDVTFERCTFWGTSPGIMQAGAQDPTMAAPATTYARGVQVGPGNVNWQVLDCTFHFCDTGVLSGCTTGQSADGLLVRGCRFRGDWWDKPYVPMRFTPSAYNSGTRVLTIATGSFAGRFSNGGSQPEICAIPLAVTTGTSFGAIFAGAVAATGKFGSARAGDVLETASGIRAELAGIVDADNATIRGWEALDTYEPCAPPSAGVAWRLMRYYAAIGTYTTSTTITLYMDPVNIFTGELLPVTPVGVACRALTGASYTGLHANLNQRDLRVLGNLFRGSWADQCSVFDSPAPLVEGNHFEYGQDEGITCTRCEDAALVGNTFAYCGVSAIALSDAHRAAVVGNAVSGGWGLVNHYIRGAIDGTGQYMTIAGNSGGYNTAAGFGGQSNYLVGFYGESGGTIVGPNASLARLGDLLLDTGETGIVYTVGVRIVGGAQANNAYAISGAPVTMYRAADATAGATSNNAPQMLFQSTRWTGSASTPENFIALPTRLDSGANRYTLKFQGPDSVDGLVLGAGGLVAVGYQFPALVTATNYGQFHVKALDATYPVATLKAAASQTADILQALDSSDNILLRINKGGYFVTNRHSAPADGDLAAGDMALWLDQTNGAAKLMVKAKSADGTVVTGNVALA